MIKGETWKKNPAGYGFLVFLPAPSLVKDSLKDVDSYRAVQARTSFQLARFKKNGNKRT